MLLIESKHMLNIHPSSSAAWQSILSIFISPASPGAPEPTGTKPDERPSRSTLPVGSQSTAKPLISSTGATTSTNAPSEAVGSANSGVSAALKPPAMRSRALSLQARTTATGESDIIQSGPDQMCVADAQFHTA